MHPDSLKINNHENTTNFQIVEVYNRFQKPQVFHRVLLNEKTCAIFHIKNDSPGFGKCFSSKASANHSQHAQNLPKKSAQVIECFIRDWVLFGLYSALLPFQRFCLFPIPISTEVEILPAIPKWSFITEQKIMMSTSNIITDESDVS